ncbi:MAG: efflux transporter outer membrane subunit [Rhodocyclaceae bacterium]
MATLQRSLCALAVASALAACAVGPDFRAPQAAPNDRYADNPPTRFEAANAAQTVRPEAALPAQWWRAFGSAELDRAVNTALSNSPTLAQASARLRQAQEDYAAQQGGTEWPSVDLQLKATRQQVNPAAFGIPNVPNPGPFNVYNASINVSYTLDVFGGNRRMLEGAMAQVDYQRFQFEAARQSLAANVTTTFIRLASTRAQIDATTRMLAAQSQQLTIMQQRESLGAVATVDVRNQATLVAQTRASLAPLEQQSAQLRHQLATYMGTSPGEADVQVPKFESLSLPRELPLSLPSALARQRPDIRAAEALWHQASADVGVATANLYPQFTITGSFGSSRTRVEDVSNGVNVWSIAAGLMQPIFRGGALRAEKRSAEAAYDAAAAGYRQTVLQALQQVADVLQALQHDADAVQARSDAATLAEDVYHTTQQRYSLGAVSHLALLDAERTRAQTERDRIAAAADRMADTAALFQSLGGDWNAAPVTGSRQQH